MAAVVTTRITVPIETTRLFRNARPMRAVRELLNRTS